MVKQHSRNTRARNIFLTLFVISTCLALLFISPIYVIPTQAIKPSPSEPVPPPAPQASPIGNLTIIAGTLTSCLTSMITFVGFVFTTIISWRKEGRETAEAILERKQKAIELEKEQLELEKLKSERKKP
jgi:hypothetical protein